jgi:hypothetical protein
MAVPLGGTGLSYAASAFLALFLETLFYGKSFPLFELKVALILTSRPVRIHVCHIHLRGVSQTNPRSNVAGKFQHSIARHLQFHVPFWNHRERLLGFYHINKTKGMQHLGIDAYRAMEAFIYFPGGAFAYLLTTGANAPAYVLKNVIYNVQTILGDGFIVIFVSPAALRSPLTLICTRYTGCTWSGAATS